jgi:fumarate hydratase class II
MSRTEERKALWGGETEKAIANFPVSGEPIPAPVARWLGRIKAAAARVNAELGLLDADKAERIAAAGDRIAAGELDDNFPIDVFQTGSGTSSNMNANEVMANLAGEDVHPNDDVNMGQSSNDVFPSAVHLAALDELVNDLLPALVRLGDSLEGRRRSSTTSSSPAARTGWTRCRSRSVRSSRLRRPGAAGRRTYRVDLERVGQIPLGGTAVGPG